MKRKVELTLTKAQARKVLDLIDSFEDLMGHNEQSNYKDCLKAADVLSSKLLSEIRRIEKSEATDAKLTAMLSRARRAFA